jgi:hypothetical protein
MSSTPVTTPVTNSATASRDVARRITPLVSWGLVAGGAVFFVGGSMHPKADPPDVTLKEHMRVMFEDPIWYPSHLVLLVGMVLTAVALSALVRGRGLTGWPRVQTAAVVAAISAGVGAAAMVLHLLAAVDADRIAEHHDTPFTDVTLVVETITTPFFGLAMAALAALGAATRTLGNWVTAAIGIAGGVAYALAGATILFTDLFDPLFPAAAGIAVWTFAAGVGLLLRRRTPQRSSRN